MRLAAVLVLCCVLAEGATKNKWKDKKCVKKQAQGLCAATNCPKKAKKCKKTVKKCALTCGGNGAAAVDTCGCTVYQNGASVDSRHLGVCQKRELVNGDLQTICTPGPCAGDWEPCKTMSPPPPPSSPPPHPPCAAHTKNTAVYHKMMDIAAGGGGNGCDRVTTGYDAALNPLTQCMTADGKDNILSVGGDLFNWPIKDLCPEACGGRQRNLDGTEPIWADCVFSDSSSYDNDAFVAALYGTPEATCAVLAASPPSGNAPSAGGYCDEPLINWLCGASCRDGVAYSYDECALPFGEERWVGECPVWIGQGYYADVAGCLADSANWVSDTFGSCPGDPTGVGCGPYTRSALGAGSCP